MVENFAEDPEQSSQMQTTYEAILGQVRIKTVEFHHYWQVRHCMQKKKDISLFFYDISIQAKAALWYRS
jgi:hypothetical protein